MTHDTAATATDRAHRAGGTLFGVGVGPGDPSLLTLKAHRLITRTPVLAYIGNADGDSMARSIAAPSIAQSDLPDQVEIPIRMPMCTDRDAANRVYDWASDRIAAYLDQGSDVAFLCAGDPFFYASFAYVFARLAERYRIEVVPGITAVNAACAATGRPLGLQAENIAIVSGRLDDRQLLLALREFDHVAILKPGLQRVRLLNLIAQAGRTGDGCYIEYIGHQQQRIVRDLRQLEQEPGPYFSVLLINRSQASRSGNAPRSDA